MRGIVIRTERLLLRPFQAEDVDDGLVFRNDEQFVRFLRCPYPYTRQDAEAWVSLNMTEPWDRFATFAIVSEGRVIGDVSLTIDPEAAAAMLGYSIGRAWWGRGITVEAAQAVMRWGFGTLALKRIWAAADARNAQSRRVLEKLGMRQIAMRRGDHRDRHGELGDSLVYELRHGPGAHPPVATAPACAPPDPPSYREMARWTPAYD